MLEVIAFLVIVNVEGFFGDEVRDVFVARLLFGELARSRGRHGVNCGRDDWGGGVRLLRKVLSSARRRGEKQEEKTCNLWLTEASAPR